MSNKSKTLLVVSVVSVITAQLVFNGATTNVTTFADAAGASGNLDQSKNGGVGKLPTDPVVWAKVMQALPTLITQKVSPFPTEWF